jgi:hypothetical protein
MGEYVDNDGATVSGGIGWFKNQAARFDIAPVVHAKFFLPRSQAKQWNSLKLMLVMVCTSLLGT